MSATMLNGNSAAVTELSKTEVAALVKRLRRALGVSSIVIGEVLRDLAPDDIAVLETFAQITRRRAKDQFYVNV